MAEFEPTNGKGRFTLSPQASPAGERLIHLPVDGSASGHPRVDPSYCQSSATKARIDFHKSAPPRRVPYTMAYIDAKEWS